MSKPINSIIPEKLKEKSHLLYKIQQKHAHWDVPKCAILIGAGCSYPIIPLGNGLITYCKQLCYLKDVYPKIAAQVEAEFLKKSDPNLLNDAINNSPKASEIISFEDYVIGKEIKLKQKVNLTKDELLKKIPSNIESADWNNFEDHFFNDAKYGFWLDAYNSSPRERQRFIEGLVENCNPGGAYIILALLIEMRLISNILTTNFDDFINDTILYYTAAKPRFYADDELSQFITIHNPNPNIIKLHGDYRYANLKNTDKETLELSERMEGKLRELLNNLDLIVIGYQGSDYSIMNVLQKVKSPNCELVWCDLDENNVHWRVANLINHNENSWFIKIKGFDDIIKDFYLEFVKTPPDLIEKAKIRQDELDRYVQEYNKVLQENAELPDKKSLKTQEIIWTIYNKAIRENDHKVKVHFFSEVLKLDPLNVHALIDRGISFKFLKEFGRAMQDLDTAIELNPNLAKAYLNRGYILEENGKYLEAIDDFDKAEELGFPNKALLFNNYAVAYRRLKDFPRAVDYVIKAIEYNPEMYQLYGTLALIYSDKGDDENFYKYIEICLEKGCQIKPYVTEDPGFEKFKDSERFIGLLKKFSQL